MKLNNKSKLDRLTGLSILFILVFFILTFAGDYATNLNLQQLDDQVGVELSWIPGENFPTKYVINRSDDGGPFKNIKNVTYDENVEIHFWNDTIGLKAGSNYKYRIYTRNETVVNPNFIEDTITLNKPYFDSKVEIRNIKATRNGTLLINWSDDLYDRLISRNSIKDITLYRINYSDSTIAEKIPITNKKEGYFEDNQLKEGDYYTYNLTINFTNLENYTESFSNVVKPNEVPRNFTDYIKIDREKEEITLFVNGTDYYDYLGKTSEYVSMIVSVVYDGENIYSFDDGDLATTFCMKYNDQFNCEFTLKENEILSEEGIKRGKEAVFTYRVFENTNQNFNSSDIFIKKLTQNAVPRVYDCNVDEGLSGDENFCSERRFGVNIMNTTSNDKPKLQCNYVFVDLDNDSENTSETKFKWFIKNEGFNDFVEVANQTSSELSWPIFDKNDVVICSVSVSDGLENGKYFNSTEYTNNDNSAPFLYFLNSSTTKENPAQIGDIINLTAKILDSDLISSENMNISFCKGNFNSFEEKEGSDNTSIGINSTNNNVSEILWLFSDVQNIPIEKIEMTISDIKTKSGLINISRPIYDFYVYEVDSYGEIPKIASSFIASDFDNILVKGIKNIFTLEPVPIAKEGKFLTIKMCIDEDNDGSCGSSSDFDGEYFTFISNKNSTYSNNVNGSMSNSSSENSVGDFFASDNVRLIQGLKINGISSCGEQLICSLETEKGEKNSFANCQYKVNINDGTSQEITAFAQDELFSGIFGPDSLTSNKRSWYYYVNHPPHLSNNRINILKSNLTNPLSYIPTENIINSNNSLLCNFSVEDSDGAVFGDYDWKGFFVEWWFKPIGSEEFLSCNELNVCADNHTILEHGNTNPGDEWYCEVTPYDDFVNGTKVKSETVSIGFEDSEEDTNRPIIIGVDDNSDDPINSSIYLGENLNIDVSWKDPDSTKFKFYVCAGNYTDALFRDNGCFGTEYYRTPRQSEVTGVAGEINRYTISFPLNDFDKQEYNYTVYVCDDDLKCSGPSNVVDDSFHIMILKSNVSVKVVKDDKSSFSNNIAYTNDNLNCDFSYMDPVPLPSQKYVLLTQENFSQVNNGIDDDKILIEWYKSVDGITYTKQPFDNLLNISNSQINHNDMWYCSISFLDQPVLDTKNSSKILVVDPDKISTNAPTIETLYTISSKNDQVDVGDTAIIKLKWNDLDSDKATIYVCDSDKIYQTGCLNRTLTSITSEEKNTEINLNYDPINSDNGEMNVFVKVCDENYNCSAISNTTLYINNRPSSENVTVIKKEISGGLKFECAYDYVGNEIPFEDDFEDLDKTEFRWNIVKGETVTTIEDNNRFYVTKSTPGYVYCEVKVKDSLGNSDVKFIRSNNTLTTLKTNYNISIMNFKSSVRETPLYITGILKKGSNNTLVTAYTYIDGKLYPFKNTTARSFDKDNFFVVSGNIVKQSSVGDRLIYLERTVSNMDSFNGTIPYIGFGENKMRSNFQYYNYTYVTSTNNYMILNLSQPLETNISINDEIFGYKYVNVSGRFNISLDLFSNEKNTFELFSDDGGSFVLPPEDIFIYDNLSPKVSINSTNKNQSIVTFYEFNENTESFEEGGFLININDKFGLNINETEITIRSTTNEQNFNLTKMIFGGAEEINMYLSNLSGNPSTKLISSYDITGSSINLSIDFKIGETAATNNYTVFVKSKDLLGNEVNYNKSFWFNNSPIEVKQVQIFDNVSKSNLTLRSNQIKANWTIDQKDNFNLVNFLYLILDNEDNLLTEAKLTNLTEISEKVNVENGKCYKIKVKAVTRFGITEESEPISNCINYSSNNKLVVDLDSENIFSGGENKTIFFNTKITFDEILQNTLTISYSLKTTTGDLLYNKTRNTTSSIFEINQTNIVKDSTWDGNIKYYLYINATGFNNQTFYENYTAILDNTSPVVKPLDIRDSFNNSDNYSLYVLTQDDFQIKSVKLNYNLSGIWKSINVTKKTKGIFNNYSIHLDELNFPSDKEFNIIFNITDYARNSALSDEKTVKIDNRPPRNLSILPTIFWNRSALLVDESISFLFEDPDNDNITFNLTNSPVGLIITKSGNLQGTLKTLPTNTTNISIKVTDNHGLYTEKNMTIALLDGNCSVISNNPFFIGFSGNCTAKEEDDNSTASDGGSNEDNSGSGGNGGNGGSGGSGGSDGSRRGRGGSSYVPTAITNTKYSSYNLYNIEKNTKKEIEITTDPVTKIEFELNENKPFTVISVTSLNEKPKEVDTPIKKEYRYFKINHTNIINKEINYAKLIVGIPKNNEYSASKENWLIGRWNDGKWEEYPLIYLYEKENKMFFSVRIPGLSYFVILRDEKKNKIPVLKNNENKKENLDEKKDINLIKQQIKRKPQVEMPSNDLTKDENNSSAFIFIILGGFLIIMFGGGSYIFIENKHKNDKKTETTFEEKIIIDPLEDYIGRHLKKGISEEEIKSELLKAGWKNEEIDKIMKKHTAKKIDMSEVDQVLVKQIQYLKSKKMTKKEIEKELIGRHIPEIKIKTNINYVEALNKLEKQIRLWVKEGYTKKQIRNHLITLNWPLPTIYDTLKKF